MANFILSPNMSLPVPVVGVDPGPDYANNINSSLTLLDQHDHSAGKGNPITPSGININAALGFNNNAATGLASLTLTPQSSVSTSDSLYVTGVDLYFIDGNGNNIRMTTNGGIAGAPGNISGMGGTTASVSYSAGTFTFQSAASTNATIAGSSFVLTNNVASSKTLTLSPPTLSTNYTVTLPALPAQTNVMTLDVSGNMGSITYNAVAEGRTRATGTSVGVGGVAISASSGSFTTSASSPTAVTNLSVTITTSGRPVMITLMSDGNLNSNPSEIVASNSGNNSVAQADIFIFRGSTQLSQDRVGRVEGTTVTPSVSVAVPPGVIRLVDVVSAGTYTYTVKAAQVGVCTAGVQYCKLVAYEL